MAGIPIIYDDNEERLSHLPFESSADLPFGLTNFRVRVTGEVTSTAQEFAIEVKEGEKILFHFNPRWLENRTVLNASTNGEHGWGPEADAFFPSLKRNSEFEITITALQDRFYVQVNGDELVPFNARIAPSGVKRTLAIRKVKHNDVRISLVELIPIR